MSLLQRVSDFVAPRFSVVGVVDLKTHVYDNLTKPEGERILKYTKTHTVVMRESFYGFRRRVSATMEWGYSLDGIPLYGHIKAWQMGGPWPRWVEKLSDPPKKTAKLLVFDGGKSPNNAA